MLTSIQENEIVLFNNKRVIEEYIYCELEDKLSNKPEFKNLSIREIEKLLLEFEGNHLSCAEIYYLRLQLDKLVGFTYFEKIQFPTIFKYHNNYFYEFYDDDSIYVEYDYYDGCFRKAYYNKLDFMSDIDSYILEGLVIDYDETECCHIVEGEYAKDYFKDFEKACFNFWAKERL